MSRIVKALSLNDIENISDLIFMKINNQKELSLII